MFTLNILNEIFNAVSFFEYCKILETYKTYSTVTIDCQPQKVLNDQTVQNQV